MAAVSETTTTVAWTVEAGDAAAVHNAAHSLKSSSAQLGARHLSDIARTLEQMAREEGLESAPELHDQLEAALAEALAALDEIVETETSG